MRSPRWALLLSGRGSTAKAVMENIGQLDIRLVVSSRKNAHGLVQARRQGLPTFIFDKTMGWDVLHQALQQRKIERIFLLGFMKIIPPDFIQKWKDKIVNVHPSLLPNFPGLEAMEKSFESVEEMGVTVHVVTAEMDAGPILLQHRVFTKDQLRTRNKDSNFSFSSAQTRMSLAEQRLVRRVSEVREAFL
jgi:phosphoribosylglycinamide formyltransferase-1